MLNGFVRSLFAYSAAAFMTAGLVQAQDAQEAFQRGVLLLQQSKDAEALEAFREALNADPSNEEAFELWKKTEQRIWDVMLARRGEYEKIARSFLKRATVARKARSSNAAVIEPLVAKALSDDASARRAANFELASNHGEYAVPYLVDALGNADETNTQVYAILACEAIGRDATLPLVECLESTNKTLRLNASMALSYIGDTRSIPALLRAAQSESEDVGVREVAQRAVAKMNEQAKNAQGAYLAHAKDYLRGSPMLLREGDISEVVWSFEDGALKPRKVPSQLFPLELAKDSAYGALQVDPSSRDALVTLAQVYLAEQTIVDETLKRNPDSEAMAGVQESVGELGITVLAAGPDVIRDAVNASIEDRMWTTAVRGMGTLAKLEDPSDLSGSPLLSGLGSADKRVRYAAALALSEMNADLNASQSAQVVSALGDAVLERSVRVVRYLDENTSTHGVAAEASSQRTGTFVDASAKPDKFLAELRLYPNVDVVVFNQSMTKYTAQDIIRWIRQTSALANTKIVLVTSNLEKAQEVFDGKVDGFLQAPITVESLQKRVGEVLEGVPMNANDERANAIAVAAAEAAARLDTKKFPIESAAASLAEAAKRQAAVAVPALNALGRSAGADQIPALLEVLNRDETEESVRIATAGALGSIMGRTNELNSQAIESLKKIAMDKGMSAAMRSAAVAALGKSPISASERAELFRSLRVNPSSGSMEG